MNSTSAARYIKHTNLASSWWTKQNQNVARPVRCELVLDFGDRLLGGLSKEKVARLVVFIVCGVLLSSSSMVASAMTGEKKRGQVVSMRNRRFIRVIQYSSFQKFDCTHVLHG